MSSGTNHDAQSYNRNTRKDKQNEQKHLSEQDLTLYWLLAGFRIALTFVPQTGYLHPDEYFQTIEVIAGDVFDLDVQRPWEFNVSFPMRSIVFPKLLYGIPYVLLEAFAPRLDNVFSWEVNSPYIILLLPRLAACLLSFVTDYCLYKICILYGQKYRSRLLILGSSYVLIVYGTRTMSNSIEMALTSLLLYLVADSMLFSEKVIYQSEFLNDKYITTSSPTERVKLFKMRAALPSHSLRHCLLIASVFVAGVFNRPTFLAFGFPPVVFWIQRGINSKSCGLHGFGFHIRIFIFILCTIPALLIFIVADSFYYGYLTWNEIGMGDLGLHNFVVTPFNFVLYNSRDSNLADHGLHPKVTHLFVNIPVLFNVLGLTGMVAVYDLLKRASQGKWHELPRIQSIMMLMTGSILVPVMALSLVSHQEARFLIPLTLPFVFLYAQEVYGIDSAPSLMYHTRESIETSKQHSTKTSPKKKKGRSLINLWILINVLLTVFFGFLHQGGIYPLMSHIKNNMQKQTKLQVVHLVTSHVYPIPYSLLTLRNSNRQYYDPQNKVRFSITRKFYSYELGSKPMSVVHDNLKEIIKESDLRQKYEGLDYKLYLALPSSVLEDFLFSVGTNLTVKIEKVFYPHLSTEAMPRFMRRTKQQSLSNLSSDHPELDKSDFSFSEFEVVDEKFHTHQGIEETSRISLVYQTCDIFNQLGLILLSVAK